MPTANMSLDEMMNGNEKKV